jgi:acyl carrier protein
MGLELVEIVMDVEEIFGISLPDTRLSEMRTVGELCDCIIDILGREKEGAALSDSVFLRLCEAIQSVKGTEQGQISADTRLSELFPFWGRKRAWKRLEKSLGLPLPPTQPPGVVRTIVLVVSIVLGWVLGLSILFDLIPPRTVQSSGTVSVLVAVFGLVLGFLAICLCWLVGCWLTLPLARFWPKNLRTVGDLSQLILEKYYGKVVKKEQRFNPEEVWNILRRIVAAVLGVDQSQVTREARFVEDLGAG